MTTKLNLSVEKRVVQKAKRYARTCNRSLSEIVTNYLDYISSRGGESPEIDPEVLKASGQIPPERIPEIEEPRYRYLKDKHLHD